MVKISACSASGKDHIHPMRTFILFFSFHFSRRGLIIMIFLPTRQSLHIIQRNRRLCISLQSRHLGPISSGINCDDRRAITYPASCHTFVGSLIYLVADSLAYFNVESLEKSQCPGVLCCRHQEGNISLTDTRKKRKK